MLVQKHVYNAYISTKNCTLTSHLLCSVHISMIIQVECTKKNAHMQLCQSLEEVLPIMHYDIPIMHICRKVEICRWGGSGGGVNQQSTSEGSAEMLKFVGGEGGEGGPISQPYIFQPLQILPKFAVN